MAKNRYVNTKFWTDTYVLDNLNPIDKLFFIYLLTNAHTDICGVYELSLKIAAIETGLDRDNIEKVIMPKLERDGKVMYCDGWVAIRNFQKHQSLNPKVLKGIEIGLDKAPPKLRQFIKDSLPKAMDSLSHSNLNSNTNSNTNTPTAKAAVVKFTAVDRELAQLLHDKIKNNTPAWNMTGSLDKWAEDINKIIRLDGRTAEQVAYVIDWVQKDDFWRKNILSGTKLRKQFNRLVVTIQSNQAAGSSKVAF